MLIKMLSNHLILCYIKFEICNSAKKKIINKKFLFFKLTKLDKK